MIEEDLKPFWLERLNRLVDLFFLLFLGIVHGVVLILEEIEQLLLLLPDLLVQKLGVILLLDYLRLGHGRVHWVHDLHHLSGHHTHLLLVKHRVGLLGLQKHRHGRRQLLLHGGIWLGCFFNLLLSGLTTLLTLVALPASLLPFVGIRLARLRLWWIIKVYIVDILH